MPHNQFIFLTYMDPKCTLNQLTLKSSYKAFFFSAYIHKVGFAVCINPNTVTKIEDLTNTTSGIAAS